MSNVIQFRPKPPDDIMYLQVGEKIIGVTGKFVEMEILPDLSFIFNGKPVSRDELFAFFLLTGLLDEIDEDQT